MSGSHRQHRDNPNYKSKMQLKNMKTIELNEQQIEHLKIMLEESLTEHFSATTKAIAQQIINKLNEQ